MHNPFGRRVLAGALLLCAAAPAFAQWTWTPQTRRWVNIKRLPKETAALQLEYGRSFLLQGEYKKAFRETEKFASYYPDSALSDENQFLRGEIRLAQGKLVDAAKEFELVVTMYQDSDLYEEVIAKQYEIGNQLYAQGEARLDKRWRLFRKRPFKRAEEVYAMVIPHQPIGDAAAEAQYKIGLCCHTRKDYSSAAFAYDEVINLYANSEWVDDACYGVAKCRYDSALPADYDQERSQSAIEAVDEFKGRFAEDERVAELDTVRVEMREEIGKQRLKVAQFYEKRREFDAARMYYHVVVDQFAETAAAEKAQQWLADNPVMEARAADVVLQRRQATP